MNLITEIMLIQNSYLDNQEEEVTKTAKLGQALALRMRQNLEKLDKEKKPISAKFRINAGVRFAAAFFTNTEYTPPPDFPMGKIVHRRDDGVECEVVMFLWFEPGREFLYQIRPTGSEKYPSGWYLRSRLLSRLEWTNLIERAAQYQISFNDMTGRFHKGKTLSMSIDDWLGQLDVIKKDESPVWDDPKATGQEKLL
jgi:hypothetical protein